jgi:organic radical activating enzyme
MAEAPLIDAFARLHDNLRISVTDRCNIRCFYCMPEDGVKFMPREEILSFEEIARFARVAVSLGVRKLRITGGEPLVRKDLPVLIEKLTAIPGVGEVKSGNIVAKRPVRNVADLIMIDGIGESTFDGIIKWVKDGMKTPEPSAKPAATTKPEPKATKEAKPAPAKEDAPTRKPASTKESVKDAVKEATKPEIKETPSRRKAS